MNGCICLTVEDVLLTVLQTSLIELWQLWANCFLGCSAVGYWKTLTLTALNLGIIRLPGNLLRGSYYGHR